MREIENQGSTGSCVANATVSSLELLAKKAGLDINLSRLFLYFNLREPYTDLKGKDIGSYLRDGFKMCNQYGICTEDVWEFDVSKVNTKPSDEAYTKARENIAQEYKRILTDEYQITRMKIAVAKGYSIIISMRLGKTFYELGSIKDLAKQDYKGLQDDSIGGHAMNVVGYDDELGGFIVENSWGSSWGANGCLLVKYDVMDKDCNDVWVCTKFKDLGIKEEFNYSETRLECEGIEKVYYKAKDGVCIEDTSVVVEPKPKGGNMPYIIEYRINRFTSAKSEQLKGNVYTVKKGDAGNILLHATVKDSGLVPNSTPYTVACYPKEYVEEKHIVVEKDSSKKKYIAIVVGVVAIVAILYSYFTY